MGAGASTNRNPIRTNYRWLYCPICDEGWIVDTLLYNKDEKKPSWLNEKCGHWDSHQWKQWFHR